MYDKWPESFFLRTISLGDGSSSLSVTMRIATSSVVGAAYRLSLVLPFKTILYSSVGF